MEDTALFLKTQAILKQDVNKETDPVERDYLEFIQYALNLHIKRSKQYAELNREREGLYWGHQNGDVARNEYNNRTRAIEREMEELEQDRVSWAEEAALRATEISRYRWSIHSERRTYGPPDTIRAMILSARDAGIPCEFDFPNVEHWVKDDRK